MNEQYFSDELQEQLPNEKFHKFPNEFYGASRVYHVQCFQVFFVLSIEFKGRVPHPFNRWLVFIRQPEMKVHQHVFSIYVFVQSLIQVSNRYI